MCADVAVTQKEPLQVAVVWGQLLLDPQVDTLLFCSLPGQLCLSAGGVRACASCARSAWATMDECHW